MYFGQTPEKVRDNTTEKLTFKTRFKKEWAQFLTRIRGVVRWGESCYANIRMGFVVSACVLTFLPIPGFVRRYIERTAFFAPIVSSDIKLLKDKKLRHKISEHYFNLLNQFEDENKSRLKSVGVQLSPPYDNVRLNAWHIKAKNGKPTVLFHHGRGSNISTLGRVLKLFSAHGYGVFVYDYPGFGKSEGQPSEQGAYNAGLAASKYLQKSLRIPPQRQIMMGYSLGTGVATDVTDKLNQLHQAPQALILINTFPSIRKTFIYRQTHDYPDTRQWFNPNKIKLRFDNEVKLNRLPAMPLLILQGQNDQDTPIPMLQEMLKRLNRPLETLEALVGAKHRLHEEDYDTVERHLLPFLRKCVPENGPK